MLAVSAAKDAMVESGGELAPVNETPRPETIPQLTCSNVVGILQLC